MASTTVSGADAPAIQLIHSFPSLSLLHSCPAASGILKSIFQVFVPKSLSGNLRVPMHPCTMVVSNYRLHPPLDENYIIAAHFTTCLE